MAQSAKMLTGRHVLFAMLGFFGVVFAVNGVMTWVALSTFSGIETPNAYQVGRDYNETLDAAARQAALGWQVEFDESFDLLPAAQGSGQGSGQVDALVRVTVRDADGLPVQGLSGTLTFWRPVVQGSDVVVPLEDAGRGAFVASARLPAAGRWDMRLSAQTPGGGVYYLEKRIWTGSAS